MIDKMIAPVTNDIPNIFGKMFRFSSVEVFSFLELCPIVVMSKPDWFSIPATLNTIV